MDDGRSVAAVDDSDLEQVGRLVGTDEHREAIIDFIDEDRIVEGMHHVVVADAMFCEPLRRSVEHPPPQVSLRRKISQVALRDLTHDPITTHVARSGIRCDGESCSWREAMLRRRLSGAAA